MKSLAALAFSFLLLNVGCTKGGSLDQTTLATPATLSQLQVVSYDTNQTTLLVAGAFNYQAVTGLNTVTFYSTIDCSGAALGSGSEQEFEAPGLQLQTSSFGPTNIYVSTNTVVGCFFLTQYNPNYSSPQVPTFLSTSPGSPSRSSYTPRVYGTIFPTTGAVFLYDNSTCTHLVGTDTGANFASIGVATVLTPNQTSSIYGVTREPFGHTSTCTKLTDYTHSSTGPAAPVYTSLIPVSPSNQTVSPNVIGTLTADATQISIYGDANCTTLLGSGAATDFTSSGISVTVTANSSTTLYGKAFDASGNPSYCSYLTTFVNDTIPPLAPTFTAANPVSPTRLTTYPRISGLATSDTAMVALFNSAGCISQIGSSSRSDFVGSGILAGITPNALTSIYAIAYDLAGNGSACTFLTNYTHNTIAPEPPVFNTTTPISPNNFSTTPLISGAASSTTVSLQFYGDANCSVGLGSGSVTDFINAGVQLTVPANTITTIYATAIDAEGNVSDCTAMTNYAHSTLAAPAPVFAQTSPISPSNTSIHPYVRGTADTSVTKVNLYSDSDCGTLLVSATKGVFTSSGAQVTVPANANTNLYGMSIDVYGNSSACTFLTTYTHDNIDPQNPIFAAISPISPNNQSTTPSLTGTAANGTGSVLGVSTVSLYDSFICLNKIGTGTATQFGGAGITATLNANSTTMIYAKSFDAAGNASACMYMTTYTQDNIPPGKPTFASITPPSPSYTRNAVIAGQIFSSRDIVNTVLVSIYTDSACAGPVLATATPTQYQSPGIPILVNENTTTSLYGQSTDQVGNLSTCNLLTNYLQNDLGPSGLVATQNLDGSIALSWNSDTTASPTPTYLIERATRSGGPYAFLSRSNSGNSFTDNSVSNGITYYYVVAATNDTGTSFDSAEVSITATASSPSAAAQLSAISGPAQVTLNWTGFASDMSYKVLRGTQTGGPYAVTASGVTSTNFIDNSVVDGTTYFYVVVGLNPSGLSIQSNEVSVQPVDVPPAPTNLTVIPFTSTPACAGNAGLLLTWTAPPYFTGFNIYRGNASGTENTFASSSVASYYDCAPTTGGSGSGAKPTGFYRVSAIWGSAESALSNEVEFANYPAPVLTANPGNAIVALSWTTVNGCSGYTLSRSLVSGGPYTDLETNVVGNSYTDTNVTNGTGYFYVVHANYGSSGTSFFSLEQGVVPNVSPSAPTSLILTTDVNGNPVLNWTAPTNFNFFSIYRASSPGGTYTFIGQASGGPFTDSSPIAGMNYYRITASWGGVETGPSNVVSFRSGSVTNVTATAGASNITLAWAGTANATSYTVSRSLTSGGPYTALQTTASTTFIDSSVVAATGYFYVVSASFSDGTTGGNSLEVSAMLTGSTVPVGLTVVATTSGTVSLAWAAVPLATKYNLYQSTTLTGTYLKINSAAPTNAVATSLLSQTTYYFKVSSVNGSVESSLSAAISAQTLQGPSAPSVSAGNNEVLLSWSPLNGATSYNLQRSTDGVNFAIIASGMTSITYSDTTAVNGTLYFYELQAVFPGITLTSVASASVTPGVVPLVPSGLTVTNNSTGTDLTFAWASVSGATVYNLYASTTSGGPYGAPALSSSSTAANTLSSLNSGTIYYFVLTAANGTVESAPSAEISVMTATTPAAPTGQVIGGNSITVSWSAVASASTYDLQRSSDTVTYVTILSGTTATSFNDTTVQIGTQYTYRYLPYTTGPVPMAVSAASQRLTPGLVPVTPASLIVSSSSTSEVDLLWTGGPLIASYNVYRGTVSGGPYSLISNVSSTTFSYADTAVVAGSTYFYVVSSVDSSGNESSYSNEGGVSLVAAPTGLAAAPANDSITLNWNSSAGATGYNLRRGLSATGPFGLLQTVTSGLSFQDVNIQNGVVYYYVVDAIYASNALSLRSSVVASTAIATLNLQVPIELTDQSLSSDTSPITFERTRTSLGTDNYDGTCSYYFEANVTNSDSAARAIQVIDVSGNIAATLTVPALTSAVTRIRTAFTPTASKSAYRLTLPATSVTGQLQVLSARLLVNQIGASKTKIYIPLLSSPLAASSADTASPSEVTSSPSYVNLVTATLYSRNTSVFATINDYNGWELETVVSAQGGASGSVSLYDVTQNAVVDDSESLVNVAAPTLTQAYFSEGVSSFGASNEGDQYQVSIRCDAGCSSGTIDIYKAGLWVSLSQLSMAEITFRNGLAVSGAQSAVNLSQERTYLDLSVFSNPVVLFSSVVTAPGGGSATVDLMDAGTSDSSLSGLTALAPAQLLFSTSGKTFMKSSTPLSITSGHRFLPLLTPSGGATDFNSSALAVQISP